MMKLYDSCCENSICCSLTLFFMNIKEEPSCGSPTRKRKNILFAVAVKVSDAQPSSMKNVLQLKILYNSVDTWYACSLHCSLSS